MPQPSLENHQTASMGVLNPTGLRSIHFPWFDRIGAFLAGMCAIHCFGFMLGSVTLGLTGSSLFFNPGVRWLLVLFVAGFTVGSLFARGQQKDADLPSWLLIAGLSAVITANFMRSGSFVCDVLSLGGGLTLMAGHLIQLSKAKKVSSPIQTTKSYVQPKTISLVLLFISLTMTFNQLPSVFGKSPLQAGESAANQTADGSIGWGVLAQLDIYSGDTGPDLKKALAGSVKVPGFVVPLDEEGKSFLLTPYAGACIHGPPPPINQIVHVTMGAEAKPIDPWSWGPIWVTGKLEILKIDSPFGSAGFKMTGFSTEDFR